MSSDNLVNPTNLSDLMLRPTSNFHQRLLATLAEVGDQLQHIVTNSEVLSNSSDSLDSLRSRVWEIRENYHLSLGEVHSFITCLEAHTLALDKTMVELQEKKDVLADQRDVLIDRGHELNCRLGYNALERKLDESFTDLERFTNEESAKCFRDEAEENLKKTNDHIRLANMRSCQMDRDAFHEMEKITDVFENYESDRGPFVQELDLFSDVRRHRISSWLTETLSDEDRERGERLIDYLNLEQRQRHMESQVIKNALRMYSFNASLNFDRQDNLKRLDELTNIQAKVNEMSGANRVLPRSAVAKTNLISVDTDPYSEGARGDGLVEENMREEEATGKGLHRCARKMNLATDPITDPALVARLEAALRWEENDGVLPWMDQVEGGAEHLDNSFTTTGIYQSEHTSAAELGVQDEITDTGPVIELFAADEHSGCVITNERAQTTAERVAAFENNVVTGSTPATEHITPASETPLGIARSSSSTTHGVMGGDSFCGDALGTLTETRSGQKVEGSKASNMSVESQLNSRSTHNHLCHIESQPVLPGSAEKHIAGLVRRKHSSRQVGSLTNLQDTEGTSGLRQSKMGDDVAEERDTRSQGSEPAASTGRAIGGTGNRSREHVSGGGGGAGWDKE